MDIVREKINSWDGKRSAHLERIYADHLVDNPSLFEDLIDLCLTDQNYHVSVTWLIKHHYDQKASLSDELTNKLLTVCPSLEDWQAKLHILQIIPSVNLADKAILLVDDFSREGLQNENKFVRAWAYEARYKLVTYIGEYAHELAQLCEDGMMDSPSVQVRVRAVMKRLKGSR